MAAQKGRGFLLQADLLGTGVTYTTIAGLRTTEANEDFGETDVTNKDSGGWFEQLADARTKKITINAAGVFQNDAAARKVRDYGRAGSLNFFKLLFETGETITAQWKVLNFNRSGEHEGEVQYSLTLTSHGVPTFAG